MVNNLKMNGRIKQLRKNLNLSQDSFGERLGITGGGISKLESGQRNITEQMIKSICREFHVSYLWLKTGEGEMFESVDINTTALFDRIMAGENETAKAVFRAFAELDDDEWKVIEKIIKKIKPE